MYELAHVDVRFWVKVVSGCFCVYLCACVLALSSIFVFVCVCVSMKINPLAGLRGGFTKPAFDPADQNVPCTAIRVQQGLVTMSSTDRHPHWLSAPGWRLGKLCCS